MIELQGLALNRMSYALGLLLSRQSVRPILLRPSAITCVRADKRFMVAGEALVIVECAGVRYLVIENYATVRALLTSGRVAV